MIEIYLLFKLILKNWLVIQQNYFFDSAKLIG